MALKVIGNRVVLEGASEYIAASKRINKAIEETNQKLGEQAKAAIKAALPDASGQEAKARGIGQRLVDALTAPFRLLKNIVGGIIGTAFSLAKNSVVLPAQLLSQLFVQVVKNILVAYLAKNIVSWIFNPSSLKIPASAQAFFQNIGQSAASIISRYGGEAGQAFLRNFGKLASSFSKYAAPFLEGKLSDTFGQIVGLQGGPMGIVAGKIASSVLDLGTKAAPKIRQITDEMGGLQKAATASGGAFANVKSTVMDLGSKGVNAGKQLVSSFVQNGANLIQGAFSQVGSMMTKVGMGIAAVVAALIIVPKVIGMIKNAVGAVFKLMDRGANFQGLIDAFEASAARANVSSKAMLAGMRVASNGMIADIDLIRRANLALAGASGQVATEMGKALPQFLKIARAQARATGQDVNFLFESLVTGVKRSSPMLIDNTGLVLKVGEANEKYAKSVGKTVEALTAQEKQIALIQAVIEAGSGSVANLDKVGPTAEELKKQQQVMVQNSMDRIAYALQPLYETFLKVKIAITSVFTTIADFAAPVIEAFAEIGEAIFDTIGKLGRLLYEVMGGATTFSILRDLVRGVAFAFYGLAVVIKTIWVVIGKAFEWGATQISTAKALIIGKLLEMFPFLEMFRDGMYRIAGRVIGAFAAGAMDAFNTHIAPVIIGIAKFIADFLMGNSPPPMGPLKDIDKGAANVMQAWIKGFVGVSLEPVSKVAKQVSDYLGPVAKFTMEKVEAGLKTLDQRLLPFQNRLKIVNDYLSAMTEPFEKAKELVANRLDKAAKLLTEGKIDASQVRALDKQMELIQARLEAAQEEKTLAELQFSLAKAAQQPARTRLEIQKAILDAYKAEKEIKDSAGGGATEKGAESGGGGSGKGGDAGMLPGALDGGMPALDFGKDKTGFSDPFNVKGVFAEFGQGVQEGFIKNGGLEQTAKFDLFKSQLGEQTGRIKEGVNNLPNRILGGFKGIPDQIKKDFIDPLTANITNAFSSEGELGKLLVGEDSIFNRFKNLFIGDGSIFAQIGTEITTKLQEWQSSFTLSLGEGSPIAGMLGEENIFTKFKNLFTGEDGVITSVGNSIAEGLLTWQDDFALYLGEDSPLAAMLNGEDNVFARFKNSLMGDDGIIASTLPEITKAFGLIFGEGEESGLPALMKSFRITVDEKMLAINNRFHDTFIAPESPFQQIKGNAQKLLDELLKSFQKFASASGEGSIGSALTALGGIFKSMIVTPTRNAMQSLLDTVFNAISETVQGIAKRANDALGIFFPDEWLNFRIYAPPLPTFHKGGEVKANLLQGEGVLSLPMMRILTNLESRLSKPMPQIPQWFDMPPMAGTSINRAQTYNVDIVNNHPLDSGESVMQMKQRYAMGWG